jgi:hypothetical protein
MNEFTDLTFDDEKSPAQKIAENNAKIAELKARKAELEAKRGQIDPERLEQMRVAANRARAGDASFIHSMYSADADKKNLARKELETAQEYIDSYDNQLEIYDNEIRKAGDPTEKNTARKNRELIKKRRERLLEKYPGLETSYVDVGEGEQTVDLDYLEAKYDSMSETLTDQQRLELWDKVDEYEKQNGVSTKSTALKKKIKKTASDTDKANAEAIASKAIEKARVGGIDYTALSKSGSYKKKVELNGKPYVVTFEKDGDSITATCNSVVRFIND